MRNTRVVIAGIGATSSLVAASACVFVLVSAVIAFNGWPGISLPSSLRSLVVDDAPSGVFNVPGPVAVAGNAASAAGAVRRVAVGPPASGLALGAGALPGPSGSTASDATVSLGPFAGSTIATTPNIGHGLSPGTSRAPLVPGLPSLPPQVRSTTGGLANVIQTAGTGLGATLGDTSNSLGNATKSPALGPLVSNVGDVLNTTIKGLGDGLAGALQGLSASTSAAR